MIVALLLLLSWLTRVRESFLNMKDVGAASTTNIGIEDIDPKEMIKKMRDLMDKYDTPDLWGGIIERSDKDPGQLARMHLGISND